MLGNILTDYLIDLATKYIWYEGVCVCVCVVCVYDRPIGEYSISKLIL